MTQAPGSVTETGATLNGGVNPNRLATTYHFEYGTTTLYEAQSPAVEAGAGSGSSTVAVSTALTGLIAGTTYHYRLVATNAAGPTLGSDHSRRSSTPRRAKSTTRQLVMISRRQTSGRIGRKRPKSPWVP